jgi:hypothetical protein
LRFKTDLTGTADEYEKCKFSVISQENILNGINV